MPKKREGIQRKQTEQTHNKPVQKNEQKNSTLNPANMAQSSILQMQQLQGNAYVQRMIEQGAVQREEEEATQSTQVDEAPQIDKEIDLTPDMEVDTQGETELDLYKALDLGEYEDYMAEWTDKIETWGGLGKLTVNGKHDYDLLKIEGDKDGKIRMNIDPALLSGAMQALQEADPTNEPDITELFGPEGLRLKASMHYKIDDSAISEADLDIPSDMADQDILPYPVIMLQVEGEIGQGLLPETIKVEGGILLFMKFAEKDAPEVLLTS